MQEFHLQKSLTAGSNTTTSPLSTGWKFRKQTQRLERITHSLIDDLTESNSYCAWGGDTVK